MNLTSQMRGTLQLKTYFFKTIKYKVFVVKTHNYAFDNYSYVNNFSLLEILLLILLIKGCRIPTPDLDTICFS